MTHPSLFSPALKANDTVLEMWGHWPVKLTYEKQTKPLPHMHPLRCPFGAKGLGWRLPVGVAWGCPLGSPGCEPFHSEQGPLSSGEPVGRGCGVAHWCQREGALTQGICWSESRGKEGAHCWAETQLLSFHQPSPVLSCLASSLSANLASWKC